MDKPYQFSYYEQTKLADEMKESSRSNKNQQARDRKILLQSRDNFKIDQDKLEETKANIETGQAVLSLGGNIH